MKINAYLMVVAWVLVNPVKASDLIDVSRPLGGSYDIILYKNGQMTAQKSIRFMPSDHEFFYNSLNTRYQVSLLERPEYNGPKRTVIGFTLAKDGSNRILLFEVDLVTYSGPNHPANMKVEKHTPLYLNRVQGASLFFAYPNYPDFEIEFRGLTQQLYSPANPVHSTTAPSGAPVPAFAPSVQQPAQTSAGTFFMMPKE